MFGKKYGSAHTKDIIKVLDKSTLSDCLDHILNHLDTSLMSSELAERHAMIRIAQGDAALF